MIDGSGRLPRSAWAWVAQRTASIVLVATGISVATAYATLETFANGLSMPGLVISVVLPVVIGGPMSFLHLMRLAQLRRANQKLRVLASTDSLTSCLNRRAFTQAVNSHLADYGALLVIDADHFKVINDQHGHDRGDEVLQIIAAAIRDNVRQHDTVGRIGGEEFGVFLRGASVETARFIAERIRGAVQTTHFAPDGRPIRMSVSVGGACFQGASSFSELFRSADQRLYGVKQSGRNRVDIAGAGERDETASPAAMAS